MTPLATIACAPVGTHIWVEPRLSIGRFRPGMDLCFTSPGGTARVGYATVQGVDYATGELHFEMPLNCSVVTIASGDEIREYETPCTRCRCKRCGG